MHTTQKRATNTRKRCYLYTINIQMFTQKKTSQTKTYKTHAHFMKRVFSRASIFMKKKHFYWKWNSLCVSKYIVQFRNLTNFVPFKKNNNNRYYECYTEIKLYLGAGTLKILSIVFATIIWFKFAHLQWINLIHFSYLINIG